MYRTKNETWDEYKKRGGKLDFTTWKTYQVVDQLPDFFHSFLMEMNKMEKKIKYEELLYLLEQTKCNVEEIYKKGTMDDNDTDKHNVERIYEEEVKNNGKQNNS